MKHALIVFLFGCMSMTMTYSRERSVFVSTDTLCEDYYINRYISLYKNDILHTVEANTQLVAFIEEQLMANSLPMQLRNLAIIESGLDNKTISWAGAAGCWQLMPEESRTHGLTIDPVNDERYDILKSTRVAIQLLKELYTKYHDWLLVIAAYNCGAGRVDRAIRQNGKTDFWKIQQSLPEETRSHVKKFIAVGNVLDGSGLLYENNLLTKSEVTGVDTIYVSNTFQLAVIAQFLQIPESKLADINKDFEACRKNKANCPLILPTDLITDFMLYRSEILRASI